MTAGSRIDSVGTQVLYMQGMEGRKVVSARQRFWSVCRADGLCRCWLDGLEMQMAVGGWRILMMDDKGGPVPGAVPICCTMPAFV